MKLTTPATAAATGADAVRSQLTQARSDRAGLAFVTVLLLALATSVVILAVLITDVVTGGWGVLTGRLGDFLSGTLGSAAETSGLSQAIRGTFYIGVFVVLFAFPTGIAAAIYLEEYGTHGRISKVIDISIRNLAGVPSVVYGILGLTIFVQSL
ncbi:MAG: hypothetical protein ACLGHQ_04805, partial [Acidimicrobiia bacterium]